jgi:hypothetical protein
LPWLFNGKNGKSKGEKEIGGVGREKLQDNRKNLDG